jgi:hypothetical protein
MHRFMSGVAAVLLCSMFGMADLANGAPMGGGGGFGHVGVGGFHSFRGVGGFYGGFRGYNGFYRGLYPYTLFGYPNYYSYGGYYPYSSYGDVGPDCHFVWVKRTVKRKTIERGIWRCF